MRKPDFAFKAGAFTFRETPQPGVYQAEPGGAQLRLSLEHQEIPPALHSPEVLRAVKAWLMTRGGRTFYGSPSPGSSPLTPEPITPVPITPEDLDRPPKSIPQRIVSIAPSNSEILAVLDGGKTLVGVEDSSDYPQIVKSLPRLGPDLHVDMDALVALEPDLVLASLSVPGMERNVMALENRGVPVLVLAPRNLSEIMADIIRVGKVLGLEERANGVVDEMKEAITVRTLANEHVLPKRVFLEWWPKPMFTPGESCWSNEMIRLAGGVNVFSHLPTQSGEVTAGQVAEADPEIIFVSWCGVSMEKLNTGLVLKREGLEGVKAIRNQAVFPLDEALIGRPGPRVMEGIARMAELIKAHS